MPKDEIELSEDFIVLAIPEEAVEVTITAKVFHDGELVEASKTMGVKEVRDAFEEARNGYIPGGSVFSLTPLDEAYAEELKQKQLNRMGSEDAV